jgi:hypothetical protein
MLVVLIMELFTAHHVFSNQVASWWILSLAGPWSVAHEPPGTIGRSLGNSDCGLGTNIWASQWSSDARPMPGSYGGGAVAP